ncbi:MAG TPA: response regulator transcription factor [Phaeodactylibacter sp.]|nr:response regulator transcription factor [Phaeodactylibacter sp.]
MEKLRAILIDDEPDSIKALENDIRFHELPVEVIAKCHSGREGIIAIKAHEPDVIFLDVDMPRMNGFGMLELLEDIDFEIIFVSGYNQYAHEAFKFSAVHYLSKPVDEDDLKEAVSRVQDLIKSKKNNGQRIDKTNLDVLIKNIQTDTKMRFAIPHMEGYVFYPIDEIIYCEANGNSTKVVTTSKNYISGHNLKKFEERLPNNIFCRIHQSFIINMHHVKKYNKGKGAHVILTNGDSLTISEGKKANFVNRFKW